MFWYDWGMTKYVIGSGGLGHAEDKGRAFVNEMLKGLGNNPKLLYCFFADPREFWESKFHKYKADFSALLPEDVTLEADLAMPDTFAEQCAKADAIYMHSGENHLALYWLRQFDLPKIFDGKVVATSSASSNSLSTSFYSPSWRQIMDGLSILPIKFMPHFKAAWSDTDSRGPVDWQKAYDDLAAYGDTSLPLHALRDGEFVVIEK